MHCLVDKNLCKIYGNGGFGLQNSIFKAIQETKHVIGLQIKIMTDEN